MSNFYFALSGAIILGCWVIGLFFFKFWRESRDVLFFHFGIAFWVFALERFLPIVINFPDEPRAWLYVVRLFAFLFIAFAIIGKNREGKRT